MKKIILSVSLMLGVVFMSNAQFHVELGPSFQSPSGDFAESYDLGVGFGLEPRIVLDKLAVGVYVGALAFAGGDLSGQASATTEIDAAAIVPIIGTATYKILDSKITPYVGGGLGMYTIESVGLDASNTNLSNTERNSEFGFMARGGVFIGRLNLGASYHNAGDLSFIQMGLGVRIGPW